MKLKDTAGPFPSFTGAAPYAGKRRGLTCMDSQQTPLQRSPSCRAYLHNKTFSSFLLIFIQTGFFRQEQKIPQIMGSSKAHLEICGRVNATLENRKHQLVCFQNTVPRASELESRGVSRTDNLLLRGKKEQLQKCHFLEVDSMPLAPTSQIH